MTAAGTGVRRAVLPRHETRMPADYGRPSALTEAELFAGYRVRLEMLRGLGDAPASPYDPPRRVCPCREDHGT